MVGGGGPPRRQAGPDRRGLAAGVAPVVSITGTGLVLGAFGLLPGLLGTSLHGTLLALCVAHWVLAGLMPFSVGVGLALAVRQSSPEQVNGRGPAVRSVLVATVGSLLAAGVFWVVGVYGGAALTKWSASALDHGHPSAFTLAQSATVVGLGIAAGLLMARSQWRGTTQVRR